MGDGKLTTDFDSSDDHANSIAIESDDKIVALGYSINGINTNVAAARYNTNGSLDNTFDGDGKLTDSLIQGDTHYTSTAIESDGKIVAAGYTWNGTNYDFAIARYNTNGTLDSTFSHDGKQTTDFGSTDDEANAMVIQADGKILLAGSAGNNFGLARYNSDGSPDISFDADGKQTTDFGSIAKISSIAIQSDGKIVASGSGIARYNSDGSPDVSFDVDGKLTTPFYSNGVTIQNDGKIVIVGGFSVSVARYNSNGSADSTFNNGGLPVNPYGNPFRYIGNSIAIQTDGKLVIGGYYINDNRQVDVHFALFRLNNNGMIDSSFNGYGIASSGAGVNYNNYGTSVLIQNDNKILLAGYSYNGSSDDFTIARFNTDGSLDNNFSSDGLVVTPASAAYDRIAGIAINNDKLYAVGYGQYPGNFGVVVRYSLPDGGALPVSILDFTGALQNKSVLLKWKIAAEINIARFIIERSANGNRFLPINSVVATGANTFTRNYSVKDEKPLEGINFYRLKLFDKDGTFTYSNIISVKINADNKLQIFPNPAKRILFVQVNGYNENAIVQIFDADGRKLKEMKVFLNGVTSFPVDISS